MPTGEHLNRRQADTSPVVIHSVNIKHRHAIEELATTTTQTAGLWRKFLESLVLTLFCPIISHPIPMGLNLEIAANLAFRRGSGVNLGHDSAPPKYPA